MCCAQLHRILGLGSCSSNAFVVAVVAVAVVVSELTDDETSFSHMHTRDTGRIFSLSARVIIGKTDYSRSIKKKQCGPN